jgi:hypothetical protein
VGGLPTFGFPTFGLPIFGFRNNRTVVRTYNRLALENRNPHRGGRNPELGTPREYPSPAAAKESNATSRDGFVRPDYFRAFLAVGNTEFPTWKVWIAHVPDLEPRLGNPIFPTGEVWENPAFPIR